MEDEVFVHGTGGLGDKIFVARNADEAQNLAQKHYNTKENVELRCD